MKPVTGTWNRQAAKKSAAFLCPVALLFANLLCVNNLHALPKDPEVVNGTAEFKMTDQSTLTINASDKAIVNYKSFDIAQNERVIVNLPSVTSQILNRVNSPDPTRIYGVVSGNGMFILVNESGIYVAPTASINAASAILSTRDITNANFIDGNYLFQKIEGSPKSRTGPYRTCVAYGHYRAILDVNPQIS